MAKYTRTDCPLYGGEYCKKLNMKSCRTCTVTNDNAAGIKADIDAIESLMPEGGMASSKERSACSARAKRKTGRIATPWLI